MSTQPASAFETMSREQLLRALEMFAKNWLAHDGCWFLAAEERLGMETAIDLDTRSWARFAAAEARRIMATFDIPPGGGLGALEKALNLRMYSLINSQHVEWSDDRRGCVFSRTRAAFKKRVVARICPIFPASRSVWSSLPTLL